MKCNRCQCSCSCVRDGFTEGLISSGFNCNTIAATTEIRNVMMCTGEVEITKNYGILSVECSVDSASVTVEYDEIVSINGKISHKLQHKTTFTGVDYQNFAGKLSYITKELVRTHHERL